MRPRAAASKQVVGYGGGANCCGRSLPAVDRQQALELLPEAHALALRLADDGADTAIIADQLDVEPEAVPLLLRVAAEKLASLPGP